MLKIDIKQGQCTLNNVLFGTYALGIN